MLVSRQRILCIEIFKTLKKLNTAFMNDIFSVRTSNYSSRNPNNLNHFWPNQVTFGSNSLRAMGLGSKGGATGWTGVDMSTSLSSGQHLFQGKNDIKNIRYTPWQ